MRNVAWTLADVGDGLVSVLTSILVIERIAVMHRHIVVQLRASAFGMVAESAAVLAVASTRRGR